HSEAGARARLNGGALRERCCPPTPDHRGAPPSITRPTAPPPPPRRGPRAPRRYAEIAPSAPHALHMPSHIFSMLGYWEDSIQSNLASAASSKEYAAKSMPGAVLWLHQDDFAVYAYLQLGQDRQAKRLGEQRNALQKG